MEVEEDDVRSCWGKIFCSGRRGTSSVEGGEGESGRNEVRDKTARFGIIHPLDRSIQESERDLHDGDNNVN